MTKVQFKRAMRRALPILLVVIAVLIGATLRVRYLQREMMTRWRGALQGGAITTQATVDEWFADRKADAEALAFNIAVHAAIASGDGGSPPFSDVLAPVVRRGKFVRVWVVDAAGSVIASSHSDSIRGEEHRAVVRAIATRRTTRSVVMPLGAHEALMTIAAPVQLPRAVAAGVRTPAAVVLRTDIVQAFSPWASGRPNAAMSIFATAGAHGIVLISACPEQPIPVCIVEPKYLAADTPAALALAQTDTFGIFRGFDGLRVLAVTRFDHELQWGVVRRIPYADAVVPLNTELAIEGAFLFVLLKLGMVGAYAVNRMARDRRLNAQRAAMEHLSVVVDASTDGIISLDQYFAITMVNGAVERMLGYPRASLVGRPVFTLFAPEWHTPLATSLQDFARSDVAHAPLADTERCIAVSANGQFIPVDAHVGRDIMDGVPLYVVGLRNVSDRARTELSLDRQRHVLDMIASGAPVAESLTVLLSVVQSEAPTVCYAVYELDEERQVARLVAAPGLPPAFAPVIGEVQVGPASAAVGTAIHRGRAVFSPDIATDPLWTESRAFLIAQGIHGGWALPLTAANGHVIGALACYYDKPREFTPWERTLARAGVHLASIALSTARDAAALRASEASFRSLVENAPSAIFRETHGGTLISTNRAMIDLLGYASSADLVNAAALGQLYHDPADRAQLLCTLEADDIARGVEIEWRRADGSLVTVRVSARAYRDDHGDVWLWEGYAEDVTSLRAAEGALRRSERLAAVGQLISGVAHELNNPLSSIMHFAEDLLADQRSSDDAEALGVIRDQARRARAIVRDLLSFVRQREANVLPLSLSEIVAATTRAMGPALDHAGIRLHLLDRPQNVVVLADRAGLEQIVTNLVSNAAHAAGRGGDVWVCTESTEAGCQLVVEDSGPGIAANVLPRIFDPFFTTKDTGEGTGLGLSVTLGIVEQFGGRIVVGPRAGGSGTRFTVSFSCVDAGAAAVREPRPDPAVSAAPSSRLALVIDDEPTIRAALRRFFTRRGWTVEEAADGGAGLALLKHHGHSIAIVICDVRMPGFSGIELHDRLAATEPALLRRFVFSTGDVASAEAASFVQRTQCPVLQKPFELRMLDEIIARIGDGRETERVVS